MRHLEAEDVVWFVNHKCGEIAYMIDEGDIIRIFTKDSKWMIYKDINRCSREYTLYHSSSSSNHKHYHVQMTSLRMDYLIWRACIHDYPEAQKKFTSWPQFLASFELYLLGREIAERASLWDFVVAD